ncbi:hypothetical protein NQ314_010059 [Rhamnusium bicolor]|uniref:Uncharacterized protein n=1 Tax=Rhamnusium bicolor TaxID=1586634 RepID=A0AAV8XVK5_9CUCU|nr:hypothetical protein NQ314_010059 [Rhamnusium bicolor]
MPIDPEDDDDLKELEELEQKKNNRDELTLIERVKLFVEEIVKKVGFFGILACASVSNVLNFQMQVLIHIFYLQDSHI